MTRQIILGIALVAATAMGEMRLPAVIGDNMVLQQGMEVPVWGWAAPGEKVTVSFAGQNVSGVADKDGLWRVKLAALKASGEGRELVVTSPGGTKTVKNVVVGEVWIASGQSNMEFPLQRADNAKEAAGSADDSLLRLFSVPKDAADEPQQDVKATWQPCSPGSVPKFSAVGYFFGRELRKTLKVPVGVINTSYGGTPAEAWTPGNGAKASRPKVDTAKEQEQYEKALAAHREAVDKAKRDGKPVPKAPRPPQGNKPNAKAPSVLYNAMVAPLQPFAIKGVIWYQGEANAGKAKAYQTIFPSMINAWRTTWGQGEFPFLFVQIAPYKGMVPEIREAQLISWKNTPNTAMAVITDLGDANDIHPRKKEPVGQRLSLAARAIAYGEKVEYSGPVFESMKAEGSKAVLTFTHVGGGLVAQGGALKGFEISEDGKTFIAASASIAGDTVVVVGEKVGKPVAVRYGWANVPEVNLYNKAGLPATPFRTQAE